MNEWCAVVGREGYKTRKSIEDFKNKNICTGAVSRIHALYRLMPSQSPLPRILDPSLGEAPIQNCVSNEHIPLRAGFLSKRDTVKNKTGVLWTRIFGWRFRVWPLFWHQITFRSPELQLKTVLQVQFPGNWGQTHFRWISWSRLITADFFETLLKGGKGGVLAWPL